MNAADDLLRRALDELEVHGEKSTWVLIEEIRAYLDAPKDEPRKVFICALCECVYCDAQVSECDCTPGAKTFGEAWIVTHPPTKTAPRKPMTVEEMKEAWGQPGHLSTAVLIAYTRAVEKHHGIGGGDE